MNDPGPAPLPRTAGDPGPTPFLIGEGRDPTAVMGRRIGAYVLDGLVPLLAGLLVILAFGDVTRIEGVRSCSAITGACGQFDDSVVTANGWAVAAAWALPLLYAVVFSWIVQGRTGATPGKAVFGVRVVDATGGRPGLTKAFLRTLLLVVDTIGCCLPIVGLVAALSSKGHRRVGDMAAGTFVVDRADTGRPIVLPAATPPPAPPAAPPASPPASPPTPQWDAARGTYVLWDATRGRWTAFDQAAQRWYDI